MTNHWRERANNWDRTIGPPKRPVQSVIDQVRSLVGDDGLVLLLGVTPQLASAFTRVHAVDRESEMIRWVWPGDTPTRRAECGDWLAIDGESRYRAIVGDGSLNMAVFPGDTARLLANLHQLLEPGGRLACRIFTRPETPPTLEQLMTLASEPGMGFDAWRTLQSHHLTGIAGPNVPVQLMLDYFNRYWPDRRALGAATGWDPERIGLIMDTYQGSNLHTSFPTERQWMEIIPPGAAEVRLVPTGGYELAQHFPILTFTKAR
jgi:hypothetical protein